jgi:GNAT superfamily N-acetyltransferase
MHPAILYSGVMIEGPRAACEAELPDILHLSNRAFYPDGRIEMGSVLPLLFSRANAGNLRIMTDGGRPVAMVGMVINDLLLREIGLRAGSIGSVCTLPEYRGQGFAGRLMDDAMAHAAAQGASLLLVSGGRGLYRRMACIDAGLYRVIEVDRRAGRRGRGRVRQWTEQDSAALEALHSREEVRFVRAPGEMAVLLRARAMFCRPARTWVVEEAGKIAAYLCVSGPGDRTGSGIVLSRELAGSREAVLDAAAGVLKEEGAQRLDVEVPASDGLVALAAGRGMALRAVGRHGTLKVMDRGAFLRAIAPRLERWQHPLPDSLEDLAALVFGSAERTSQADPDGPFPVPLPGYGLNYV